MYVLYILFHLSQLMTVYPFEHTKGLSTNKTVHKHVHNQFDSEQIF